LAGCRTSNQATLNVHFLKNSIPAQLVGKFRHDFKFSLLLNLVPEPELANLFTQLQSWKVQPESISRTVPTASLVSLGDYWLTPAIEQGLIQPLNPTQLSHWNHLPSRWQSLVSRDGANDKLSVHQENLNSERQVWGAPYRWGTTVIAYRKDKFKPLGWAPSDWDDLWRPELKRRFSLLDHPREVIGLTLKKMGHSYNSENIKSIPELAAELRALNQQVKLYNSSAYLQPLVLGDTWLAVGWSTDILPIMRRNDQIRAVIPRSGTALWSDVWVRSASKHPEPDSGVGNQWIDFWWQPEVANQLSRFSNARSPILTDFNPADNLTKSILLPDQQVFDHSEFLKPLPAATIEQYRSLWQEIRTSS
jgi:putative spermidine/putrescine transport system substrate-binding protein